MIGHGDRSAIRWLQPLSRDEAIKSPKWGRVLWTDGKYHVWWRSRLGYTSLCGVSGGKNINYGLFRMTEADKCKRCLRILTGEAVEVRFEEG